MYVEDDKSAVQKIAGILKKMNVEHKTFGPAELKRCYPMLEFEERFTGVLEPSAGTIRADKALRCLQVQSSMYSASFFLPPLSTARKPSS